MIIGVGILGVLEAFLVVSYFIKGMSCKQHEVDKKEISQFVIERLRENKD